LNAGACLNCGTGFGDGQRFCGSCGQRTDISRKLTLRDIGHDLAHAITHADHSIFSLVRALATRPGIVAREYTEGKRKRHFGPFAFLLITVGLASAIILVTGVEWFSRYEHGDAANLLQRHVNLVILFQVPLLALFCWALFRRERRNFAEHLVLAAYTSGFHALFMGVVETPTFALMQARSPDALLAAAYLVLWLLYFALAASQFYSGNRAVTAIKGGLAVIFSQVWSAALAMLFLYVMKSLRGA
jgi:hypothetical protein